MRVIVDHDRCEGHGLCTQAAPAAFSFDDDGELVNAFADAEVPDDEIAAAREAVDVCPVAALRAE
ncbi:ferredoxin [Mycobacterium sp. NPDC006124]|uniref:ferredoxin n=1 Tax=Mycobacterium sp. NPDC006124 TaxID=3156729 RepID=UPI0033BC2134